MAPKAKKGGRGKTVNITEFNENYIHEDAFDWADDQWRDSESPEGKLSEKIAKARQEYSRTANNTLGEQESFRTAGQLQPDAKKFTDADLQPPYVAHFGNLRNGTTDEDFLSMFHKDSVVTHRLISQDGKSFGFVEFDSARAISIALMLDGTFRRGRKMYADLATAKQVERLLNRSGGNEGGRPGISREGAGQMQPGGLSGMDLTRNVFGGQQQPDAEAIPQNGSRSNFGSRNDLQTFGELSRDVIGSAVQAGSPPNFQSPTSVASPLDFASWRNDAPAQQPDFPTLTENHRSDDKLDRRPPRADRKPQSPAAEGGERTDFGSWRDEPRAEQQTPSGPPCGSRGGRGGRGGGRGRENSATTNPENATGSPKTPVAERDWANFRK